MSWSLRDLLVSIKYNTSSKEKTITNSSFKNQNCLVIFAQKLATKLCSLLRRDVVVVVELLLELERLPLDRVQELATLDVVKRKTVAPRSL